jgi:hypothetical protein
MAIDKTPKHRATPTPKPNPPPPRPSPEASPGAKPPAARASGMPTTDSFTPSPTPSPSPGASPTPPPPGEKKDSGNGFLDGLQTALDVVGFIPGIGEAADLVNAGISAARGNYLEAGLSLVSLIPGVGDAVGKGAKYALKAADSGAAKKALDALKSADLDGFFKKLSQNKDVAGYIEPLRKALDNVGVKLAEIAGVPNPRLAMAGGTPPPPRPNTPEVQTSGGTPNTGRKGGYKRGDHVFNHGLTKLGLETPKNSQLLTNALDTFNAGLKRLESTGSFDLVGDKSVLLKGTKKKFDVNASDANSEAFGNSVKNLREQWSKLDGIMGNPKSTAQQRAQAVPDTVEALKALRKECFDPETVDALKKAKSLDPALQRKIEATNKQLDELFNGLIREVERLMPSPGELGRSLSG